MLALEVTILFLYARSSLEGVKVGTQQMQTD